MAQLELVAASEVPVMLLGETGTGKDLLARVIHVRSPRAKGPMVAINCGGVPETLMEAELFGHERGAFTGADRARAGRFEAAHGGTLFMDEVGELPLALQTKLLRVLQEMRYEPLGSRRSVTLDARMIYATHRDLRAMVAGGRFREDLYYRMQVIALQLPPLRDRLEDLDDLIDLFLDEARQDGKRPVLSPAARRVLKSYPFPGNIRELRHAVLHGVVLAQGADAVDVCHLPLEIGAGRPAGGGRDSEGAEPRSLSEVLADVERSHIEATLSRYHGRRDLVAMALGISRKCLWEKMRLHGIDTTELGDGRSHPVRRI